MACRLIGAKPLSEPMMVIFYWNIGNKFQWNFNLNSNIFIQENAFDNVVWKMVAILSRPQCVNWYLIITDFDILESPVALLAPNTGTNTVTSEFPAQMASNAENASIC